MKKKLITPTLEYLKFGNVFSGGVENFNFKMFPNVGENKVKIVVWEGKNCCEKSKSLFEETFDLSPGGFEKAVSWLNDKYEIADNK